MKPIKVYFHVPTLNYMPMSTYISTKFKLLLEIYSQIPPSNKFIN